MATATKGKTGTTSERPSMYSPEWTQFVLGQLDKNEIFEGKYPTGAGLFRVFETLFGPILDINDKTDHYTPATENSPGQAVVTTTLRFTGTNDKEYTVSASASVSPANMEEPYNLYPVASASSIAFARALKRALRLKCITRDELGRQEMPKPTTFNNEDNNGQGVISSALKNAIQNICRRVGIDSSLLVSNHYPTKSSLDELNHTEGQELLRVSNKAEQDPKSIKAEWKIGYSK